MTHSKTGIKTLGRVTVPESGQNNLRSATLATRQASLLLAGLQLPGVKHFVFLFDVSGYSCLGYKYGRTYYSDNN